MNDRMDPRPLSAEKQELLQLLLAEQDLLPVSFAQQRLWFLDQLEPGNPAYNVPAAVRLTGTLNVPALEHSFQLIVHRHESLRTTFAVVNGQPVQVIASTLPLALPLIDLSTLPETVREAEAQHWAYVLARTPFDLSRGPLLQMQLIRLDQEEHLFCVTMHHIISDAWSLGLLVQELAAAYPALSAGKSVALPELPIQYADFAVWQRDWLQGSALERQVTYWKQQLADVVPALNLPTDRQRPATQTFHGARHTLALPAPLVRSLQTLSRREGGTLFMTLLAAFQVLLYRHTGQEDITVGTPIANRNRRESEGLIGFFVNTLVLRTRLTGHLRFREVLRQVREVALAAYAHQDLPFEKLVDEIQPDRALTWNPLFQVMFALQNAPRTALTLPGLKVQLLDLDNGTAKVDLLLNLDETGESLSGWFEYNTDLFDPATVARLAARFQLLLEGISADPEQSIAHLPLLSESEQYLLAQWNETRTSYPRNESVPELFEAQAARTPEAIALVFEDVHLTYRELNCRANQLAHYLRRQGLGPETLVGVSTDRSVEMIVALLGILKAGGAYLPLDPSYPRERLTFMLAEGQVSLLLTQQHLIMDLPQHQARPICLDTDWPIIAQASDANPINRVAAENLAYVMYTSGSTGKPKGISVVQRGIVRLVKETRYADFSANEVFLQFAPLAFDASTLEIWGALLNGGRLVIFPTPTPSLEELGQVLRCYGVTTLWLTAGLFHQMVDHRLDDLATLRQLLAGGDVLSTMHVSRVRQALKNLRLINGYGPTENTTFTCYYPVSDSAESSASVPIGRPIANTQSYILDRELRPVPVGVSGELYVGGDGLARGYLHRADLTAERFVPSPFGHEPGTRLYRTGDLARYLPDGNLEFLGRTDDQIKLRGFRIELGEIERTLAQHAAVHEVMVLARDMEYAPTASAALSRDKRLVAYVVARAGQTLSTNELRRFLKDLLPDYMIPAAFVILDAFPLNPNGKVDRRALPAPQSVQADLGNASMPPRTPAEEMLANIWCQVLGLNRVSSDSNFFELGGHSLLATQLITRLRTAFQVDLPLRALFEAPTISQLAARLAAAQRSGGTLPAIPIKILSRQSELPLSFAQRRLWFLNQLGPASSLYNISTAVRLVGHLNLTTLEQSLNEIVRRHETLRTTFAAVKGQPIQQIAPALTVPLPVIDLHSLPANERAICVQQLIEEEGQRPFDLAQGPLLRVKVLRLAETEQVLLLTMHHIISDGWSLGVLIRELVALYPACVAGAQSPLPDLPIQYVDFAAWQHTWVQTPEVWETQVAYWKQHLAGAPAVLELPTDYPRPAVQTFRGERISLVLPQALSKALVKLSHQEDVTLFMLLLAGFKILLHRYTGQSNIVVGVPIANRTQAEIEGLIGFFVNTLVLHTELSGDPTFPELLRRVREVTLGAYAYQDLPFEKLVEEIHPERDLSRTPLFQVFFNMLNFGYDTLELPGVKAEVLSSPDVGAKFDLTLYVQERPQGLRLDLLYNADLFDCDRMIELLDQFHGLLSQLVDHPAEQISRFSLLTPRAKALLPVPAQVLDFRWDGTMPSRFSQQARRTPQQSAIVDRQSVWTYQDLEARSNRLANYLRSAGVQSGEVIAVYAHRSAPLVLALFGILKAGAAFVILDPAHPAAFLCERLRLAAPRGWLQLEAAGDLPAEIDRFITGLNGRCRLTLPSSIAGLDAMLSGYSVEPPQIEIGANDLAYIAFTSGTTGLPRGILGTQAPLAHFFQWQVETFSLKPTDRFSLLSGLAHDPLLRDVFTPLCLGATLCIPETEPGQGGDQLLEWFKRQAISVTHLTPALARLITAVSQTAQLPSLRYVFLGGDILTQEITNNIGRLAPAATCVNFYGTTETPQAMGYYLVPKEEELRNRCEPQAIMNLRRALPVGQGIRDTQLLILNASHQVAGISELGEICIRTPYLSKGYLGEEALTQVRFVTNPFTQAAGDRIYRTGDLGRYSLQGEVEFGGRSDSQVKIRDFRVELSEIEAALRQHPAVQESVVVARDEPGSAGKRLIAYVVARQEHDLATQSLRSWLKEQLPSYMIPTAFVQLASLPLTPNAKIDRRALPDPEPRRPELETHWVPPQGQREQILAAIWRQVLNLEEVGAEDNFFDLGGHSLLLTQVHSQLRSQLDREVTLMDLFRYPTIRALAHYLDRDQSAEQLPQQGYERADIRRNSQERQQRLSARRQALRQFPEGRSD
ncbi:nonribosomal peptide synthetase DhbF [Thermoflexales bacterium]|nr:nonribosomal peptide synthetase DhbF [Thermoflexales bacterium]